MRFELTVQLTLHTALAGRRLNPSQPHLQVTTSAGVTDLAGGPSRRGGPSSSHPAPARLPHQDLNLVCRDQSSEGCQLPHGERAGIPGFEPRTRESESPMLPITPYPNALASHAEESNLVCLQATDLQSAEQPSLTHGWGDHRELNPACQSHILECFHNTLVSALPPGLEPGPTG